jgi:Transposase
MPIVGGLDIHRKQLTFDYLDTVTGQVTRGQVAPADREHLGAWLARFAGRDDVAFAAEGCTGWRYVAEELAAAGIGVHLAEPADTAFARGRKRHAKTDKTDARHLRTLLAEGRLPEYRVPPAHILECRALPGPGLPYPGRARRRRPRRRLTTVTASRGTPAQAHGPQPNSPDGELPRPAPAEPLPAAAAAVNGSQADGLIRLSGRIPAGGEHPIRLLIVYGRPALITARKRAAIAVRRRIANIFAGQVGLLDT